MSENEWRDTFFEQKRRFQALGHHGRTTIFYGPTERDRDPAKLKLLDPPLEFKDDWMAFRVAHHLNIVAFGEDYGRGLDESLSSAVASGGSES